MKITESGMYEFIDDAHIFIDSIFYDRIKARKGARFKVDKIVNGTLYCLEAFSRDIRKFPACIDLPVRKIR